MANRGVPLASTSTLAQLGRMSVVISPLSCAGLFRQALVLVRASRRSRIASGVVRLSIVFETVSGGEGLVSCETRC